MPFLGNIGPGELILLLVIILVIFGPGRLPEIGQAVGKGIREFRKAASDVTEATKVEVPPASQASAASATAPAAATSPTPPAASSPAGDEEERRQYEALKARFEPAPTDEPHGDASQPSA